MNKQKKQTIIIAIIVLLLVGVYFLIDKLPKKQETPVEVSEKLLVLDTNQITDLEFKGSEEQLIFTRENADSPWILKGHEDREVETSKVTSVINSSCNFEVQQKLENISDYSQFGFDEPNNVVTIKTASETHVITFGSYNSAAGAFYLMLDSDKAIYVLSSNYNSIPYGNTTENYLVALPEEDSDDDDSDADDTGDTNTDTDENNSETDTTP